MQAVRVMGMVAISMLLISCGRTETADDVPAAEPVAEAPEAPPAEGGLSDEYAPPAEPDEAPAPQ